MSGLRVVSIAVVVVVVGVLSTPFAGARETFHSGGVGHCGGCHGTHGDTDGPPNPSLLIGGNSTDTCLQCHETENGNTWGLSLETPGPVFGGGPFIFLTEDNLNDGPGGGDPAAWIPGNRAGHNVVSPIRGVVPDPDFTTSPGGTYPSIHLTCTSCHDPHGKAGHYRLLYGSDTGPSRSDGYEHAFSGRAPVADGIALDGPTENRSNHNAYASGMSDWCASCHEKIHRGGGGGGGSPPAGSAPQPDTGRLDARTGAASTGSAPLAGTFSHRVRGQIGTSTRTQYDVYDGTGFYGTGEPTTSYLPDVPIETGSATIAFTGPTPSDAAIQCLSCHRAHASSAPSSMRWDDNIATWAEEGINSGSYAIPNPYAATAGQAQRRLCEKCHGDDNP